MSKRVSFTTKTGACEGEIAEPAGPMSVGGKVGGIVVIQEWHGINDEMRRMVARFASEGYVAVAPDLYHGAVAKNDEEAAKMMHALDFEKAVGEIGGAIHFLKEYARCNGKVAVVGFCMGGALTFAAAATLPGIACAVPFYGVPELTQVDVTKATAPIQAHFAGNDSFAKPEVARGIEKEMKAKGKPMELYVYEGAGHAFMRATDPSKYHEASATKAWERTLAFLKQHLA
jgi:carboxymethylenebutenolidase